MASQQKVALITGGSRGIGAATARLLAARGIQVVINYHHNEEVARRLVDEIHSAGGEAKAIQADIHDPQQVADLVTETRSTYGRIDILVHNAPASTTVKPSFQQMTAEEFLQPVTSDLKAAFELTRAVTPIMIEQHYGRIVYLGSGWAKHPGQPWSISIGTAKAGLAAFARYIAQELGPHGIIANTVAPGLVNTELSSSIPPEAKQRVASLTPLRRVAEPEDVARVIAYLVSEENSFVTGSYTPVNGGLSMD